MTSPLLNVRETMLCSSSLSRLSHSDYGSLSSSDDEVSCYNNLNSQMSYQNIGETHPGICPHCKKIYESPVTLQCGHSLCANCSTTLLHSYSNNSYRRTRIRMGISSVSYSRLERKDSTKSLTSLRSVAVNYRSPQCVVCGERAKTTPPVPNLELANFLRTLKNAKLTEHENPAYRETDDDGKSMFPDDDSQNSPRIRECSIAVVGARGVGKTSITRVQYGNDILFTDILCKHGEAEINNTFMIDIVDGNNSNASLLHAQGFVLMYSVTDRDSFYEAAEIFKTIEESRGETVSCVLVGSKCDLQKKRRVEAYEGQALARCIGCPFLEVSARKNDCVNEAFLELMRIVERKRISKLKQLQ